MPIRPIIKTAFLALLLTGPLLGTSSRAQEQQPRDGYLLTMAVNPKRTINGKTYDLSALFHWIKQGIEYRQRTPCPLTGWKPISGNEGWNGQGKNDRFPHATRDGRPISFREQGSSTRKNIYLLHAPMITRGTGSAVVECLALKVGTKTVIDNFGNKFVVEIYDHGVIEK